MRNDMIVHLLQATPEREALFERLGIPRPLGMRQSIFAWAWAGLDLAAEQSEFRGRGRPRSTPDEGNKPPSC